MIASAAAAAVEAAPAVDAVAITDPCEALTPIRFAAAFEEAAK